MQTIAVAQDPRSFRIYGLNPKQAKRLAKYAEICKTNRRPRPGQDRLK